MASESTRKETFVRYERILDVTGDSAGLIQSTWGTSAYGVAFEGDAGL